MKKGNLSNFAHRAQNGLSKHSPEIFLGLGLIGAGTSVVLAIKATPKAMQLIENEKIYKEESGEEFTKFDYLKVGWRPYLPAAITFGASVMCLVGSRSIGARRTAALATAYQITETAFSEYRDAAIEALGDKQEKVIREKVAEKQLSKNPLSEANIIISKKDNTLFYDPWSGRYFESDIDIIKRIINDLNRELMMDMSGYMSLNSLYSRISTESKIELENTKAGEVLGWNISDGLIKEHFIPRITEDNKPCVVLDFENPPVYGYTSNY